MEMAKQTERDTGLVGGNGGVEDFLGVGKVEVS